MTLELGGGHHSAAQIAGDSAMDRSETNPVWLEFFPFRDKHHSHEE
jgi:hypothetical protein